MKLLSYSFNHSKERKNKQFLNGRTHSYLAFKIESEITI